MPVKFQVISNACKKIAASDKIKYSVPVAIAAAWSAQTALEFKRAPKEDKKNTLITNLLIGAAMVAGSFLGYKGYQKFLEKDIAVKTAKEFTEKHLFSKVPEKIGQILRKFPAKDFIEALSIPVTSGILGGIAGEFAQRAFPVSHNKPDKMLQKTDNFLDKTYNPMDKIDDFPGADLIDSIHPSFSAVVGYSVGKEKGIKNKIKKFVFEMISGVFVPVTAILAASRGLKKIMPNNKGLRGVLTLGVGISSSFAGKAAASWFNKKVTDKIIEKEFWEQIAVKRRELVKTCMFVNNPYLKLQIKKQVKELGELGKKVKNSNINLRKIINSQQPGQPKSKTGVS